MQLDTSVGVRRREVVDDSDRATVRGVVVVGGDEREPVPRVEQHACAALEVARVDDLGSDATRVLGVHGASTSVACSTRRAIGQIVTPSPATVARPATSGTRVAIVVAPGSGGTSICRPVAGPVSTFIAWTASAVKITIIGAKVMAMTQANPSSSPARTSATSLAKRLNGGSPASAIRQSANVVPVN